MQGQIFCDVKSTLFSSKVRQSHNHCVESRHWSDQLMEALEPAIRLVSAEVSNLFWNMD